MVKVLKLQHQTKALLPRGLAMLGNIKSYRETQQSKGAKGGLGAGVRQGSAFRAVREGLSEKETLDQGIWNKHGSESCGFLGGRAFPAAFWSVVRAKAEALCTRRAPGGRRAESSGSTGRGGSGQGQS